MKDLDLGYSLVATHDRRGVYIMVDHDEQDQVTAAAPISNVYSQGWNSSLFSLSLPRNFRRAYTADFARVEGLPGVLLANQLSRQVLDQPPPAWGQLDYESYVQTKVGLHLACSTNNGPHHVQLLRAWARLHRQLVHHNLRRMLPCAQMQASKQHPYDRW